MAIFEIEIMHADEERRSASLRRVIHRLGPPDGTIIVKMADESQLADDETVNAVMELFGDIGEIVLVRFDMGQEEEGGLNIIMCG